MLALADARTPTVQAQIALALRVGLGLVFISGGIAKLERLLTPAKSKGIVDQYVGPLGYINQTFLDWLFASPLGAILTPWNFLTALSAFELVAGIMLVAGLMVRPMALFWAFLLWSFVVSLPVVTTPGVDLGSKKTYMSPAEFVQIRDIALSGLFFVLYNLGPGARSLDHTRFGLPETLGRDWEPLGLLTRLSLGAAYLIGGLFAGYDNVVTWGMPGLLLAIIGAGLIAGVGARWFALAAAAVMLWFMLAKLPGASGVIGWFNAVKREFAIFAAAGVVAWVGGGRMFTLDRALPAFKQWLADYGPRHSAIAERAPPRAR
jgi:uncharacterized membrane protein YphA (DoxX/SURF4 family)